LNPILLNQETYFASSLRVYYFFFLAIGAVGFLFSRKIHSNLKWALSLPIFFPMIFHCLFSMGTNRYRIVTQPLLLILFAYGVYITARCLTSKTIEVEQTLKPNQKWPLLHLPFSSKSVSWIAVSLFIFLGAGTIRSDLLAMRAFPDNSNKKVPIYEGPWKNEKGNIDYFLSESRYKTLILPEKGNFDIAIRLAEQFGRGIPDFQLLLSVNREIIELKPIPQPPGWVYFRDVSLDRGIQTLTFLLAKRAGQKNQSTSRINYPNQKRGPWALGRNVFNEISVKINGFQIVRTPK
jgi:hypothetical protein